MGKDKEGETLHINNNRHLNDNRTQTHIQINSHTQSA